MGKSRTSAVRLLVVLGVWLPQWEAMTADWGSHYLAIATPLGELAWACVLGLSLLALWAEVRRWRVARALVRLSSTCGVMPPRAATTR